ncbi:MAG: hypothetical protein IJU34_04885 [Bacteroidales bacterium]|nr:hypothetical protein [Bacteroidales bacterium]
MKSFRFWSVAAAVLLLMPAAVRAQSICFWTDDADVVPVRIYVDREYIGDVTAAFSNQPLLDTEGTLSVDTTPARHELTAVDKYGRVYKGWQGYINAREGEVHYLRIRGRQFREVNHEDYGYVFLDWAPLFIYAPRPYYHFSVEDLSPLEDSGLLAGMAVTAVGATAAMGVAAARNWGLEDSRFPYFALGLGTEYFSTLGLWRNVAQMKARFGGKGGISLLADAGVSVLPYYSYTGYGRTYRNFHSEFTWSVGASLDYGGLSFGVRYKPAFNDFSETFLTARVAYDWWITGHFGLNFHGGFGVGGFGAQGMMDYYDFPFGFGFLVRL